MQYKCLQAGEDGRSIVLRCLMDDHCMAAPIFLRQNGRGCFNRWQIFIKAEKKSLAPLVPLPIFKIPNFLFGNLIQSAANTIFLGANFLIALYLQKGLGLDLITTGWIMASITPGMIIVQPLVGKFYNKMGPLPFIIPGLILLSLSTWAFAFTSSQTSVYVLGFLVFCIGAASSITQTANVTSIFSELPSEYKGSGSSLYALFKQISASFGVALSTMVLSIGMNINNSVAVNEIFHYCFIILGAIPAMALFFCNYLGRPLPIFFPQTEHRTRP